MEPVDEYRIAPRRFRLALASMRAGVFSGFRPLPAGLLLSVHGKQLLLRLTEQSPAPITHKSPQASRP